MASLSPIHAPIQALSVPEQWHRSHKALAFVYHSLWSEGHLVFDPQGTLLAPRIGDLFQANARVVDATTQQTRLPLGPWTGRSFFFGATVPSDLTTQHGIVGRLTQGAWHVHPRPCLVPHSLAATGGDAFDTAVDALFAAGVPPVSPTPDHPDHPAWALPRAEGSASAQHPSYALSDRQRHDLHALLAGCLLEVVDASSAPGSYDQAKVALERGGWRFHLFEPHLPPSKSVAFLYHDPSETEMARGSHLPRLERALNAVLLRWCEERRLPRFFFDAAPGVPGYNPLGATLDLDALAPSAHARIHALAFWREAQRKARP